MKLLFSLLLALFAFVSFCSSADTSWDYILYVTRWPGTEEHGQIMPKNVTDFEIHGLWPNRNDGSYPQFCTEEKFDPSQIQDLFGQLELCWHDFQNDPYGFWGHEWEKHGTCASQVPALKTQHQFFAQGISYAAKYSFLGALNASNIIPSQTKTYSVSSISDAVYSKFGFRPVVECSNVKGLGDALWRLSLCFSKSLTLQACPNNVYSILKTPAASCSGNVYFPVMKYSK